MTWCTGGNVKKLLQEGMLWFDDSPERSLAAKIERAAKHYQAKYGCAPNTCYVHSATLPAELPSGPLNVCARAEVLPHHLWLGVA